MPKLYFRLFNEHREYIHLLHKPDGRVRFYAPIRGQCARRDFYVDPTIEEAISREETNYAKILRRIRDNALRDRFLAELLAEYRDTLYRLVIHFCFRTEHATTQMVDVHDEFATLLFSSHLEAHAAADGTGSDAHRALQALRSGSVRLAVNREDVTLDLLRRSVLGSVLIEDLHVALLRNHSDVPFVFGESPVVRCNRYLWGFRDRETTGICTEGLQVFFPLGRTVALGLWDADIYRSSFDSCSYIDLVAPADIAILNLLQISESPANVFFSHTEDADYVEALFAANTDRVRYRRPQLHRVEGALIDGEPAKGELYTVRRDPPQIRPDLIFLDCDEGRASKGAYNQIRPRNPRHLELFAQAEKETWQEVLRNVDGQDQTS